MALNQYAKTERDFTSLLNSANMSPADRDKLSAILASLVNTQTLVPGVEQQITDIETEIGDIVAAINNIKVPVWKMQVFDANGTFTVPDAIAGTVVYVTGSGGGGGGAAFIMSGANDGVGGACSGCYIEKQPYTVSAGDSITVTIGAGGAPVSANAITALPVYGNDGQASYFGEMVINGGSGGGELTGGTSQNRKGGWVGGYIAGATVFIPQNSTRFRASSRASALSAIAMGSAAGAFGDAGDAAASSGSAITAGSALPNTGAAGGGVVFFTGVPPTITITSGAGGSGKIIVEWQEFA